MNILDRVISVFSPETGVKRAAARQILDQYHARDYAAAMSGRRNKGWKGRGTSANVEVGAALTTLRNRAREFVRDNWAAQRILDVLCAHVVGTGITVVANTGSDRADRAWSDMWQEWCAVADVEGIMSFEAMQAMALRSMIEGGDCVVRLIDLQMTNGSAVPVRLLGLEGDQIDTTRDRALISKDVRLGVQLGEYGRREGLWLFNEHPGEMAVLPTSSSLVAWDDLCHLYRPLRFGQVRAPSWFAPVLLSAREVQDLMEAVIVQQRSQASFAGFLKHSPTGMNVLAGKKDEKGETVSRIEPGVIADIGDADIVFSNPSSTSAFADAYLAGMQAMAAGAGVTYDQLTGDLRQANYSSLRAGKIEFRRLIEQVQWHIMAPRLVMPIKNRVTDRALLAGRLQKRRDGYPVDIIMPANEPIDPKKDLEADILAVRAGRLSPQEFIAAWGRDPRKVMEDTKAFFEKIDGFGIKLDIDARRPANGGSQQSSEPALGSKE